MCKLKAIMNLDGISVRCYDDFVKVGRKIMTTSEFSEYLQKNYKNEPSL